MIKFHLACGSDYKTGWANIDFRNDVKTDYISNIMECDFWSRIKNDTVDYFYSQHFIEHETESRGKWFLGQCFKKLKPGGILRVATPDLDWVIKQYYEGTWQNDEWLHMPDIPEGKLITTAAEYINVGMRNWGHRFLYDYETLKKYAFEAGFNSIERKEFGKSKHQELQNLETRIDSRLIVELTK